MFEPKAVVLIDESELIRPSRSGDRTGGAPPPTQRLRQPSNYDDNVPWSAVEFILSVRSLTNVSSFSITPKLQAAQTHVLNGAGGASEGQYRNRRWFDLDPATRLQGGPWFPTITAPGTWSVLLFMPPRHLVIDLDSPAAPMVMAGTGAAYGIRMSLIKYPKKG